MRVGGEKNDFRHLALVYEGEDDFVSRALPFVREGLARDEPMLIATSAAKCARLAAELNRAAGGIDFRDMAEIGRNPARIIPVWREFIERNDGRPVRGIGEPVWSERTRAELVECEHHESLLNLAFADTPAFQLLCPYDRAALDPDALATAWRTHPSIVVGGDQAASPDYLPAAAAPGPFNGELSPAPGDAIVREFTAEDLGELRRLVRGEARSAGLDARRAHDLTVAVNELAANSLHHGGGGGSLLAWREGRAVVCEVHDRGRIEDPLAGRHRPAAAAVRGRGLWIVNQLCDLVQIRTRPDGNLVRVRIGAAE